MIISHELHLKILIFLTFEALNIQYINLILKAIQTSMKTNMSF